MNDTPSTATTYLFTDIERSTDMLQSLGDETGGQLILEHRRILRAAFVAQGGFELETQGDGFLIAFRDARRAAAAAIAGQRALWKHPWPVRAQIRVRMGLHTATLSRSSNGYIGLDGHRVARICSAGHGGQILLSRSTRNLLAPTLPSGMIRDLGDHQLKDLRRAERLYQLMARGVPVDFPPLRSLSAFAHNLPTQFTSFIGRERLVTDISRAFVRARLLTLTGTGGSGKSRLALQVGATILQDVPDGVWLVELAAITDARLATQRVASVLGILKVPRRPLLETLADTLRSKSLVLILDNCEHVLQACAELTETLLRQSESLRILATSRQALGIAGEIKWSVPPLSLPDVEGIVAPEDLERYEATQLFIERATVAAATFKPTRDNAAVITQVCRSLDGNPLAIELAAARVGALSVAQIAARLDDQLGILTRGSRVAARRQRTLRATLDWSYRLLSDHEQGLFRRLSVFSGGFSLEAVEFVCAGRRTTKAGVLELLTNLADKSLVDVYDANGHARYRLLEAVRQYAAGKFRVSPERTKVNNRHLKWYVRVAERAAPELTGQSQGAWVLHWEMEHDNVRRALTWALRIGAVGMGLRLSITIGRYWYIRGYSDEGRRWLETLLKRARRGPMLLRARALNVLGYLTHMGQTDCAAGRVFYEESLRIFRSLRDEEGIALALNQLGLAASDQCDQAAARAFLTESLQTSERLGYQWGTALSLSYLGLVAFREGDGDAARPFLERSCALFRQLGDPERIATTLDMLGVVALHLSDLAEAANALSEALCIRRDLGNKRGLAYSFEAFAGLAISRGAARHAARLLGAAEAMRDTIQIPFPPGDQAKIDRISATVRSSLREEEFGRWWSQGRTMTAEGTIVLALEIAAACSDRVAAPAVRQQRTEDSQ